ncbi:hypothetical protein [Psychrobacillus sp. FSL H8-0510]|uniref:hypothetical protein n=1 Tax=Psychrobacillus sp. FSL H8-0510 TaxID=2921394 RepID=UPI0030F9E74A
MSIKNIRRQNVERFSVEEQLKFYKRHFQNQHCEMDGCGHEVRSSWAIYDDNIYCESCYEHIVEEEKDNAKKQLEFHEQEILKLKERFDFESEE